MIGCLKLMLLQSYWIVYTNCFICSDAVTSTQRVRVFKSGSKGTSSADFHTLLNMALDIDVAVYSNSDVAVCIKFSLKANIKKRI